MTPNKDHSYQNEFFETTEVSNFRLHEVTPPPGGYPVKPTPDRYVGRPSRAPAEDLRRAFFDHVLKNPAPEGIKAYYYELVRLYLGKGPVHEDLIMQALVYIEERRDCADFVLLGIIRMLYQSANSPLMTPRLIKRAREVVLGFKYWPDEPGIDSMYFWTENHHIMFFYSEYLAGQLYPEYVFRNSALTGIEKIKRAGKRIHSWLALRYRTGFSEWLSHVYYDEDITALVNLIDFCTDEQIVRQAETVLDLVFYDMAHNSFRGAFVSSHGRSYTRGKQNALYEATMDTQKLIKDTHYLLKMTGLTALVTRIFEKDMTRNTLIAVYRISRKPGIYLTNRLFFTHAWLPRDRFDEVAEKNGWIFARSWKGCLALYSTTGFRWQTTGAYAGREVIAEGTRNIWICEAGREAADDSCGRFFERTAQSYLSIGRGRVVYDSPANGRVEFGWKGPFIYRGRPVNLHATVRYENPYGRTPFDAPEVAVRHSEDWFTFNFGEEIRRTSGLDS